MTTPPRQPLEHRTQTDDSLRAERDNSDRVIADYLKDTDDNAEVVIGRARERADAVLAAEREKADDATEAPPTADVVAERRKADDALGEERRVADDVRRRERAALQARLPQERERTDFNLHSERSRADDALAHRDQFLGIVSHDLRNLLNSVALNATAVAAAAGDSKEGRHAKVAMGRITSAVGRMDRLIGDLVDIVSIDAGKLAIAGTVVDVVPLVRESIDTFARIAEARDVHLKVQAPSTALPVWCDADRLLQVLSNLLGNALKFTAAGGSIDVDVASTDPPRDEVIIRVKDSGIGIPADKIGAVFDRFVQVAEQDKRGLGLGLYISRCLIEAHGGSIAVRSVVGQGSTFTVTLPREGPSSTST